MGQKVNPISMRLQVNKDWTSKWFVDKRDYAKFLKDDLAVRRLISTKLGSRAAINTSPEPFSNWTASFGEDGDAVLGSSRLGCCRS